MSDSVQDLIVDIAIRENNKPDSRLIAIPATEYLQSINIETSMSGAWTGTLVLFDYEGYALEDLLLSASLVNRGIQLRWGWAQRDGTSIEESAPTYFGTVTEPTPSFTPEGVTLSLELVQNVAMAAALGKENRHVPGDFKASDLLTQIAREKGWKTKDARGRETIQRNDLAHKYADAYVGYSDMKLLKEWAERTVDPSGNLFRYFFDDAGAVHFHTDNFLATEALKEYIFSRDAMGEVERFEPKEETLLAAILGGANAKFASTNSKSKTTTSRTAEQGASLPGGKNTVVNDAAYEPDLGSGLAARMPVLGRDPLETDAVMKAKRNAVRSKAIQAQLDVHGTHEVVPSDRIRVDYYLRNGTLHFLSGLYQVWTVTHEIGTSGWQTGFDMFRSGEGYTKDGKKAAADKRLDVPVTKAGAGTANALKNKGKGSLRRRLPVRE